MANTCLGFVMIDLDGVIKEDWLALSEDNHDSFTTGREGEAAWLLACWNQETPHAFSLGNVSFALISSLSWSLCVCSCLVSFSPFSLSQYLTMRLICVCVSLALFLSPNVFLITTSPRLSQPVCISSSTSNMQNNNNKKNTINISSSRDFSLPLRYSCRTWEHKI